MSPEERNCKQCGKLFTAMRSDRVFCSTRCGVNNNIDLRREMATGICRRYVQRELEIMDKPNKLIALAMLEKLFNEADLRQPEFYKTLVAKLEKRYI